MDKSIKWLLGITLPILVVIIGWLGTQTYQHQAKNASQDVLIGMLDTNQKLYEELGREKNKNNNKRSDDLQDEQGEINKTVNKNFQILSKKTDKILSYLITQDRQFKDFLKYSADNKEVTDNACDYDYEPYLMPISAPYLNDCHIEDSLSENNIRSILILENLTIN